MIHARVIAAAAVVFVALASRASAQQQHWGGSAPKSSGNSASTASQHHTQATASAQAAPGAAWNGRQPVWGGSPPPTQQEIARQRNAVLLAPYAQGAFVEPIPTQPYVPVDTVSTSYNVAPQSNSVQMQVVRTHEPEQRQLTTIEVYRLQPRFQKP